MSKIKQEIRIVLASLPYLFAGLVLMLLSGYFFLESHYIDHVFWNYFHMIDFSYYPVNHLWALASFVFFVVGIIPLRIAFFSEE